MKLLIRDLMNKSIISIRKDISSFIMLIVVHALIMMSVIFFTEWASTNIKIYEFTIGAIALRLALFSLILGLWIGYFKLILQFIDKQKISIFSLLRFFYLLPKILLVRFLSYLTIIPLFVFILNKFPYDIQKYGTNLEQYFSDLLYNLTTTYSDEISWGLYSAYFTSTDMIIAVILAIFPIWFMLRFWCLEIMIIDKDFNIKSSLFLSYTLTKKVYFFIVIGVLMSCLNFITLFMGFIFFIICLTISYIFIFHYYRLLLHTIK